MIYPQAPKFSAINMNSSNTNLHSRATNGRAQVRATGGQHWTFTAQYSPMTQAQFNPVKAFVVKQNGQLGIFTIVLPLISAASGDASGTVICSAASVGSKTVAISGLSGTLKTGDMAKFSGHDKVYMLTADQSGDGNIEFTPGLTKPVTTDSLIYNDVPFTVRLNNDVQSWEVRNTQLFNFEVDFVEVLT